MSKEENIVPKILETQNEEVSKLFEEYKESEEYKYYFEMIKNDKPNLSVYLINIILYGYFYETFISNLPEDERANYKSILTQEEKVIPAVKGDIKGVSVYESEENYKKQHPELTEIKTIGEPLTFIETTLLEKSESQNTILEN